jgi:hypothetical protein
MPVNYPTRGERTHNQLLFRVNVLPSEFEKGHAAVQVTGVHLGAPLRRLLSLTRCLINNCTEFYNK